MLTPTPTAMPTATPTAMPTAVVPQAVVEVADRLADALESSDYTRLAAVLPSRGWYPAWYQSSGLAPMTRNEAISWLRSNTAAGRLEVSVTRRPFFRRISNTQPVGDYFIRSVWSDFEGQPRQSADLMLGSQSGVWYWSAVLFGREY